METDSKVFCLKAHKSVDVRQRAIREFHRSECAKIVMHGEKRDVQHSDKLLEENLKVYDKCTTAESK